jgi:hypothetical protein
MYSILNGAVLAKPYKLSFLFLFGMRSILNDTILAKHYKLELSDLGFGNLQFNSYSSNYI